MKTYKVERTIAGVICTVLADNAHYELAHCNLHSPTGFETGYSGSGPADLAVSILADCMGATAAAIETEWRRDLGARSGVAMRPVMLHQEFKADFIAGRRLNPGESYTITSVQIYEWLHKNESEAAPSDAAA